MHICGGGHHGTHDTFGSAEDDEGLVGLDGRLRVGHGHRGAVVVVDFDHIGRLDAEGRHIRRIHLDHRHRVTVHDEGVVLVVVPRLPDFVEPAVVDPEFVLGLDLGCLFEPTIPLRWKDLDLAIGRVELVVGIKRRRTQQLVSINLLDRHLHAVVASFAQQCIRGHVARGVTLAVDFGRARSTDLAESIIEGIFWGCPLETFEALGHLGIAFGLVHHANGVGDTRGGQTVGQGFAWGIDELLGHAQAALTVHRGVVHFSRQSTRKHHMGRLGNHRGVDIHHPDKQPALLRCLVDDVHHLLGRGATGLAHGLFDDLTAANDGFAQSLGIVGGLECVARPERHHLALAIDEVGINLDQLVMARNGKVGGRIAGLGFRIWGPCVTFLVTAHAHPACPTSAAHIVRGHDNGTDGLFSDVVVVATDDAFLEGMHGAWLLTRSLGFVAPLRSLLDLRHRNAGDATALVQRHGVGLDGGLETFRMLGDEVLVDPALIDDVGQQAIEQGAIAARIDRQVQNLILGQILTNRNRRIATRVDEDEFARTDRFAGEHFLLLVHRAALQIGQPVHEEVVGLVLVGVVADRPDHVGEFGVFVAVVELEYAHVTVAEAFGVVRRTVMDAYRRGLDTGEDQLAGAPGVLETSTGAPVIKHGHSDFVWTIFVQNFFDHATINLEGVVPGGVHPLVTIVDTGVKQTLFGEAICVVEVGRHFAPAG